MAGLLSDEVTPDGSLSVATRSVVTKMMSSCVLGAARLDSSSSFIPRGCGALYLAWNTLPCGDLSNPDDDLSKYEAKKKYEEAKDVTSRLSRWKRVEP